jgi:hypothetical protein
MAFYTGRTGTLVFNSLPVAKIRDWSLETSVELLSTNTIDSVVSTFTPGIKSASGTATLLYYRLEAGEAKTQFTALLAKIMKFGAILESDRVELELNVGGGTADDIRFNAYITSAQVAASTGELSVVPIQFQVDGDFLDVVA